MNDKVINSEDQTPGTGEVSAPLADTDSMAAGLADSQPDFNPDAGTPQDSNNDASPAPSDSFTSTREKDSAGTVFDPNLHATDSEGKPKKTLSGKFAKKRGRKNNSEIPKESKSVGILGPDGKSYSESQIIQARTLGVTTAGFIINIGLMISPDFAPVKNNEIDERRALESAWADYYLVTGKKEMPPWLALMVVNGAYIMPRLSQPATRTRLEKAKTGFAKWWLDRKARRAQARAEKEQKEKEQEKAQQAKEDE